MRKSELNFKEQVFTYKYDDKTLYIAIDRLIRKLKGTKTEKLQLEEGIVRKLAADKTVDERYVHKYMSEFSRNLAGAKIDILPGIVIKFKDDSWTLADGNNKYVGAFMAGAKEIDVWVVGRQQWAPFIIRDFEGDIAHGDPILLAG